MSDRTSSATDSDSRMVDNSTRPLEDRVSIKKLHSDMPIGFVEEEEEECWDDAKQDADDAKQDADDVQCLANNREGPSTVTNINNMMNDCCLQEANHASQPSSSCATSCDEQPTKHSTDSIVDLTLHEAVFSNDANTIYKLLKNADYVKLINGRDKHGNTPLHLACMLGRSKEIVSALIQCGASVDCKNLNRWTPFQEACSYGNREIITLMTKKLDDDLRESFNKEKHKMREHLEKSKNYRLVLKWQFQSWVPFISNILPNDVTVINKHGKYFRVDTKLLDYHNMFASSSFKKEQSCLIYSDKFEKKWMIVNHGDKQYQHLETQTGKDIETKVDEIMSFDILDLEMKSTDVQLTRTTSGWIWKADKMEQVGNYNAALYSFNNVFLITRKRREHLKQRDLKRNKLAYKGAMHILKSGSFKASKELYEEAVEYDSNCESNGENWENADDSEKFHRASLPPPPLTNVTWTQYCQSESGQHPNLGREQKCKVVRTAFKAKIAMTNEFPITKKEFLDLLSIVPLKMFKKLKEFIEMKLPEGFPVRLEIPIFPFLTALITFEDFNFIDGPIDESLFSLPPNYEENPNLVPMFNGKLKRSNS